VVAQALSQFLEWLELADPGDEAELLERVLCLIPGLGVEHQPHQLLEPVGAGQRSRALDGALELLPLVGIQVLQVHPQGEARSLDLQGCLLLPGHLACELPALLLRRVGRQRCYFLFGSVLNSVWRLQPDPLV